MPPSLLPASLQRPAAGGDLAGEQLLQVLPAALRQGDELLDVVAVLGLLGEDLLVVAAELPHRAAREDRAEIERAQRGLGGDERRAESLAHRRDAHLVVL